MQRFARLCEDVARHSARSRKLSLVAEYLRALPDGDLLLAVRFLSGNARDGLSVGSASLRDAVLAVLPIDRDLLRLCHREVGDSAETIALLMRSQPGAWQPTLAEASRVLEDLAGSRRTAGRQRILEDSLRRIEPATLKYFLKLITGNLRIGLQERLVEEALALSAGVPAAELREAANRCGDLSAVAAALRAGSLHAIEARLFHPMDFMLARPIDEPPSLPPGTAWFVEDKFDGIRCQAHVSGGRVRLFSRGAEDVTASYPELVLALASLPAASVLDGELLAWRGGAALPFNVLQQRLARKKLTPALLEEIPVAFVAYDLLYLRDRLLLDRPLEARRASLESLLAGRAFPLMLSRQQPLAGAHEIEPLFEAARGRGNEGLVLKRAGSLYEAGKRGGNWLKVKRPFATLDVVITAAEQGRGRRATLLSDYTFAVRDGRRYLNIGKAYSGLTDDELRALTRLLRSLSTERFGRVLLVKPEVVLEVAFDGIQSSPRHKSGFALRFPRILRWRPDKPVSEIDTLERVAELYRQSLRPADRS